MRVHQYRAASLAALQTIHHVDESAATLARRAWTCDNIVNFIGAWRESFPKTRAWVASCYHPPKGREIRRRAVDEVLDTCGVEYLGRSRSTGCAVYYCNAGDPYVATVLFSGDTMRVACWGDMVERRTIIETQTCTTDT